MDIVKEELDAFKASANRTRWFIITAVLISVLILLHVYLEQLGFQKQQLESVYGHRIAHYTQETQKCYEDLAQHFQRKKDNLDSQYPPSCSADLIPHSVLTKITELSHDQLLADYSVRELTIRMTNNTIGEMKLRTRRVPLLGVEVPANDFVTVMAAMSLVFVIAVWVNLRGVKASLARLSRHGDPEIVSLAKLHSVLLSELGTGRTSSLARAARSGSMWLPFASIVLATVLGYWEVFARLVSESVWNFGSMRLVLIHFVIAAVVAGLHLWVAVECKFVMRSIEDAFGERM